MRPTRPRQNGERSFVAARDTCLTFMRRAPCPSVTCKITRREEILSRPVNRRVRRRADHLLTWGSSRRVVRRALAPQTARQRARARPSGARSRRHRACAAGSVCTPSPPQLLGSWPLDHALTQPHRGEGRLDRVRRAQVDPVLGRVVVKLQQHVEVIGDLRGGLGPLLPVVAAANDFAAARACSLSPACHISARAFFALGFADFGEQLRTLAI